MQIDTDNINSSKNNSERLKALDAALNNIEKEYGKGSVFRLGNREITSIDSIPTGSITLDKALGVGGLPKGRIIEIYGPESSGKTTLSLNIIGQVQKSGGIAGFIDAEHALDPIWAKNLGVDIDNLYVSQPDNGEQALEICETMARSGAVDIIVIDSVAALVPKAEIDGNMGDATMGQQARLLSQAMRKLTPVASSNNCTIIFINQIRQKIGVFFGNPETTTGGNALKFYASVRIDVRKMESIKESGEVIGNKVKAKVVKNKVAPPFREAIFEINFKDGIDHIGELVDMGVELGLINKGGAWYNDINDTSLRWQGRTAAKVYFKEHLEYTNKLETAIRDKLFATSETIVENNK